MNFEKELNQSVESTANYEGNHSLLFFSRMANSKIKKQVVDLLFEEQKIAIKKGETEIPLTDEDGEFKRDKDGHIIFEKVTELESYERIEEQFEKNLRKAEDHTDFDYEDESPNSEVVHLGFTIPWNNKKMNEQQLNIIEAHEKGHMVRRYVGSFFDEIFQSTIEIEKIEYPDYLSKEEVTKFFCEENAEHNDENIRNEFLHHTFNALEIAERMGQLKNYFGMKEDEIFTKEHLDYAKIHYVKDTGVDNLMTEMFKAITPETEEKFLEVINNAGI